MRILITGSTGFVGKHVVKAFQAQEYELALLIRNIDSGSQFNNLDAIPIQGDLVSAQKPIQEFEPDVCVHLAWEGIPDYSKHISKRNLDDSINFLNFLAMNTNCRKIIISGSCFEYGATQGGCKESDNIKTTSFFAWAKQSLYNYASLLCEEFEIDLIWFRIFYVYGPGQRTASLVPTIINKFNQAKRPDVRKPHNRNDFVYVEDVAEAFRSAVVDKIPSGIYNLGSGISTSVYEVCKTTELLCTGKTFISEQLRKINHEQKAIDFWADMNKTNDTLGWSAKTVLEEGIKNHIQAIKEDNYI